MRRNLPAVLGVALLAGAAFAFSCSDDPDRPRHYGVAAVGDSATPAFVFQPQGCGYSVAPPPTRAYFDLSTNANDAGDGGSAAPLRVRLGLGGNTTAGKTGYADANTTIAMTWETLAATRAARVRIGKSADALSQDVAGYNYTVPAPQIGLGNDQPPTYMHEVHICGLDAGTTYYYQVGGGASGAETWSATQSFATVPATGPVVVGMTGDARDRETTWQLVQMRMKDAAVNLQLFSGDLIFSGGNEAQWAEWLDLVWKDPADPSKFVTLGQQLFLPIAGNHENEAARFYGNFATPGEGDYAETFYSVNIGSTHVAMLDDQPIGISEGSDHANAVLSWIESDLKAADADRTAHPFVVVVSHRGLFSTSQHSNDSDVLSVRSKLVPLFDKYHVNVVFNGHDHEYERSKPLRAGSNVAGDPVVQASLAEGTTYVISAGSGADPYAAGTYASAFRETVTAFGKTTPYLGVYAIMTIDATKLSVKSYGLKASGAGVAGDDVIDSFEFVK